MQSFPRIRDLLILSSFLGSLLFALFLLVTPSPAPLPPSPLSRDLLDFRPTPSHVVRPQAVAGSTRTPHSHPLPSRPAPAPPSPVPDPVYDFSQSAFTPITPPKPGNFYIVKVKGRDIPNVSQHHVALITAVPLATSKFNLEDALAWFLPYVRGFLHGWGRPYTIYVVEQLSDRVPFNRGILYNIAATLTNTSTHDYFCFHDVGILPAVPMDLYPPPADGQAYHWGLQTRVVDVQPGGALSSLSSCPANGLNKYLGGVVCMTRRDFMGKIGGWTNEFWGAGREDEEMYKRMNLARVEVKEMTDAAGGRGVWKCSPKKGPDAAGVENDGEKGRHMQALERGEIQGQQDGVQEVRNVAKVVKVEQLYGHKRVQVALNRVA